MTQHLRAERGFSLVEMAVALAITAAFTVVSLAIAREQLLGTNADGFATDMARLFANINRAYTGSADFSSLSPQSLQQMSVVSTGNMVVSGSSVQLYNRYNGRVYVSGWAKKATDPVLYQMIESTSVPMSQCRRVVTSLSDQMQSLPQALSFLIALAGPPTATGVSVDAPLPNPFLVNSSGQIVGSGSNAGYDTPVIVNYALQNTGGISVPDLASFCERNINFFTVIILGPKF